MGNTALMAGIFVPAAVSGLKIPGGA